LYRPASEAFVDCKTPWRSVPELISGASGVVRAAGRLSFLSEEQASEGFDPLFDAEDEILVSQEVMEWISEMEALRAGA
jgi:hypothetical protein